MDTTRVTGHITYLTRWWMGTNAHRLYHPDEQMWEEVLELKMSARLRLRDKVLNGGLMPNLQVPEGPEDVKSDFGSGGGRLGGIVPSLCERGGSPMGKLEVFGA